MPEARIAILPDRGVVAVTGEDARKLLQGVLTNDVDLLDRQPSLFAGLLTPQGKILFDFLVVAAGDGVLIECPRAMAPDLAQRLAMYKLRAQAEIKDVSSDYSVAALWGDAPAGPAAGASVPDPRLPALGGRLLMTMSTDWVLGEKGATAASRADYDAHRIALGVPEGGRDYAYGDTFPHEALLDQLAGVSFSKGCYVGQEIVARMQHRGTARKRIVRVVSATALPASGTEIGAGSAVIGTLGSVSGLAGLALVRLDRAAEAMAKGQTISAAGAEIAIEIPPWASFRLDAARPEGRA